MKPLQQVKAQAASMTTRRRWWLITRGLLRAGVTVTLLLVLYFTLHIDERSHPYLWLEFLVGIAVLVATSVWRVRAIIRAKYPALRAPQALATTAPLRVGLLILALEAPGDAGDHHSQHVVAGRGL